MRGRANARSRAGAARRVGSHVQEIFDRPEYEPVRSNPEVAAAWSRWIDHCKTPGNKAHPPSPTTTATIMNRALACIDAGDPGRFVEAVDLSMNNDYRGVNPEWVHRNGNGHHGNGRKDPLLELIERSGGVS